jgi:type IV pilus assembly protein PilV
VNRLRRRRGRERGFTLMELLITMVVTVFGLMGVMSLHVSMTRGNDTAGRTQEAISIGGQMMETLRSERPADMMTALSATAPPVDIAPWVTVAGRNGLSYTVDVHISAVAGNTNLWKIRLEVKWTDDGSTVERMIPIELVRNNRDAL